MDGEFRHQPLAQQTAATALGIAVRTRQLLGRVELHQGGAGQFGERFLPGGGEVGKAAGALLDTEVGACDRVEFDECVDVIVGDLAGQRAVRSV